MLRKASLRPYTEKETEQIFTLALSDSLELASFPMVPYEYQLNSRDTQAEA